MLDRILPRSADSAYRGRKLAAWILGLVVLVRLVMSFNSVVHAGTIAQSADGIPLASYAPAAAATIVSMFALLGYAMFPLCVVGAVVLIRYRALIPFTYVLLLLAQLGNRLILRLVPIARTGSAPGTYLATAILALMLAGLALSLWDRAPGAAKERPS